MRTVTTHRHRRILAALAIFLTRAATGCTPLPLDVDEDFTTTEAGAQPPDTVNFEVLPDGSLVCGGLTTCAIGDEYAAVGLRLTGTPSHANCQGEPAWVVHSTYIYDADGSPQNLAAWNRCSVGTFALEFTKKPTRVSFDLILNNGMHIDVEAENSDGVGLASGMVRRESTIYTSRGGYEFRRERVTLSAEAGIGVVRWSTEYFGVFVDNVVIGGAG